MTLYDENRNALDHHLESADKVLSLHAHVRNACLRLTDVYSRRNRWECRNLAVSKVDNEQVNAFLLKL